MSCTLLDASASRLWTQRTTYSSPLYREDNLVTGARLFEQFILDRFENETQYTLANDVSFSDFHKLKFHLKHQQLTANVLSKLRRETIDLTKRATEIQKLLNAYLIKKADILQVGRGGRHTLKRWV